jgi:hypothetical protein
MREKPFLVLLLSMVFAAMGLLYIMFASLLMLPQIFAENIYNIIFYGGYGIGLLAISYLIYKQNKAGWIIAFLIVSFGAVCNYLISFYPALFLNIVFIVILLIASRHFFVSFPKFKPSPTPTTPQVASAFGYVKYKRFVKRRE